MEFTNDSVPSLQSPAITPVNLDGSCGLRPFSMGKPSALSPTPRMKTPLGCILVSLSNHYRCSTPGAEEISPF